MTPGAPRPEAYTDGERRNIATVREYMQIAYDPKRASAEAVRHLVADGATFEAHTTFPRCHDPLAYAQEHGGACTASCGAAVNDAMRCDATTMVTAGALTRKLTALHKRRRRHESSARPAHRKL